MRALLAVLAIGGCMWQSQDPPPLAASHVAQFEWPGARPPKLDLLFVIDDTPAMAPYVDRTQAMLRGLEGLLPASSAYAMPDLQIAVTTAPGTLATTPDVEGPFLIDRHKPDLSGTRVRNYEGTLGAALAALGAVGTDGGVAQPLLAARTAIETTPSFVRDDAYLGIVIVSAGDDASGVDPADVAAWAKRLKADPTTVVVGGVFPASATRLASFVAEFPTRGQTLSIDAPDYTPAIALLAQLSTIDLGVPCTAEPMDVDPATPGAQYDCTIELVGEDGSTELEPPCPGSRCWTFRPDPVNCVSAPGGRFEVAPFQWPFMPTLRGQCVVGN